MSRDTSVPCNSRLGYGYPAVMKGLRDKVMTSESSQKSKTCFKIYLPTLKVLQQDTEKEQTAKLI